MVNGSQIIIVWYVDNLKISHMEEDAEIYGPKTTISRGKVHEYLGIDIDWSQQRTMIISMIKHLQKMINNFPEVLCSTAE